MADEKVVIKNYPGNSKYSVGEPERQKKEKVVTGKVVTKKKSFGKKVKDALTGEEAKATGEYVIGDLIIPAIKYTLYDVVTQTFQRVLGVDVPRRPGGQGKAGSGFVAYNRYYDEQPKPSMSRQAKATHDFREIILPARQDAEDVLDNMFDTLRQFEWVTVADLYDFVGMDSSYTDQKWGWRDLRGSGIRRVREGYMLELPKTITE